jgi:3'-phosphoadenosine 5'-phosphosulfate sulfotransferase (PAPS reductase)/FAD synthetase
MDIRLNEYDFVIINSSAGKDSLCAIWEVVRIARKQKFPLSRFLISHQNLGRMEWPGIHELLAKQAKHFGLSYHIVTRVNKAGKQETLVEYARRRKKWPSNKQRWCTSDYKRGPGYKTLTQFTKGMKKVLYVFGFRASESPFRSKKEVFEINRDRTTKTKTVYNWLPIHNWSTEKVWDVIKKNNLPYHYAYDLGMPRLSCAFCIFASREALVLSGIYNYDLLKEYVEAEEEMGHSFKNDLALKEVLELVDAGYQPKIIPNWNM